jgi:hypothetical protein
MNSTNRQFLKPWKIDGELERPNPSQPSNRAFVKSLPLCFIVFSVPMVDFDIKNVRGFTAHGTVDRAEEAFYNPPILLARGSEIKLRESSEPSSS